MSKQLLFFSFGLLMYCSSFSQFSYNQIRKLDVETLLSDQVDSLSTATKEKDRQLEQCEFYKSDTKEAIDFLWKLQKLNNGEEIAKENAYSSSRIETDLVSIDASQLRILTPGVKSDDNTVYDSLAIIDLFSHFPKLQKRIAEHELRVQVEYKSASSAPEIIIPTLRYPKATTVKQMNAKLEQQMAEIMRLSSNKCGETQVKQYLQDEQKIKDSPEIRSQNRQKLIYLLKQYCK